MHVHTEIYGDMMSIMNVINHVNPYAIIHAHYNYAAIGRTMPLVSP